MFHYVGGKVRYIISDKILDNPKIIKVECIVPPEKWNTETHAFQLSSLVSLSFSFISKKRRLVGVLLLYRTHMNYLIIGPSWKVM